MRMMRTLVAAMVGVALLGAACGGGGESTADKKAKITTNWEALFNPSIPVSQKYDLLENGTTAKLKAVIDAASKNPQAAGTKAKVKTVTINGDKANVTYDLVSTQNDQPLLPNAQGVAVKQNGKWKVSQQTFCALLALGGASCPT